MKLRLLYILVVALVFTGCRARDVRTFEIHVPKMQNQACAEIIQRSVTSILPDSGAVKVDLDRRIVTVTYDSLVMSRKNIEFMIADVGFEANGVPANKDAEAKLPEACKVAPAAPGQL